MPEMGGKECLQELLKINPAVNVLIATGASAEDELKDAVKKHTRGVVNKPYDIKQLIQAVKKALEIN